MLELEQWRECLKSLKEAERALDINGSISMYETKKTLQALIRNAEESIKQIEDFYKI